MNKTHSVHAHMFAAESGIFFASRDECCDEESEYNPHDKLLLYDLFIYNYTPKIPKSQCMGDYAILINK